MANGLENAIKSAADKIAHYVQDVAEMKVETLYVRVGADGLLERGRRLAAVEARRLCGCGQRRCCQHHENQCQNQPDQHAEFPIINGIQPSTPILTRNPRGAIPGHRSDQLLVLNQHVCSLRQVAS